MMSSLFLKLTALSRRSSRILPSSVFHPRFFSGFAEEEQSVNVHSSNTATNPCFIHPTAIVHPNALIGQGVSIGPFCTVSPSAKLGNGCQLHPGSHIFGNTYIGDNCMMMAGAIVGDDYPGCTVIGNNNIIGHHAVIGVKCQDLKYKLEDECFLEIGDNNDIREHTSIHRSSKSTDKTVIGDCNLIMGSCHIAHDCKIGNNNILANNTLLAGHVVVEDYVHTAGATVVHQFCHLGSFSFLGGGSVVSQDVPKYTMVAGERAELRGLNLVGLTRRGFSTAEVILTKILKLLVFDVIGASSWRERGNQKNCNQMKIKLLQREKKIKEDSKYLPRLWPWRNFITSTNIPRRK